MGYNNALMLVRYSAPNLFTFSSKNREHFVVTNVAFTHHCYHELFKAASSVVLIQHHETTMNHVSPFSADLSLRKFLSSLLFLERPGCCFPSWLIDLIEASTWHLRAWWAPSSASRAVWPKVTLRWWSVCSVRGDRLVSDRVCSLMPCYMEDLS